MVVQVDNERIPYRPLAVYRGYCTTPSNNDIHSQIHNVKHFSTLTNPVKSQLTWCMCVCRFAQLITFRSDEDEEEEKFFLFCQEKKNANSAEACSEKWIKEMCVE